MVNSYVKGKINDKTMSEFIFSIYNNMHVLKFMPKL